MITRPTRLIGHFFSIALSVALALTLAGFLGCSRQDQSKQGEPGHGDHTKTAPGKKTPGEHGGHEGGHADSVLMVKTEPAVIKAGEPVKLNLMIHDATGAMIKDFETVHEKKLHLIIVRDGLDRFAHIHPEIDRAGNITDTFTFPTAGKYRLYADHKPKGRKQATAIAEVNVAGTPPSKPELVPNTPGRVKTDELVGDIAIEKAKAGGTTRISFTLFDVAGKPVADLQPYLGAMGHLVILSADGMQYVHSHPLEGKSSGGTIAFEAHFPHPGIYKGWGQFRRSDTVHDLPFVVRIE
jgi:hypothetical protein